MAPFDSGQKRGETQLLTHSKHRRIYKVTVNRKYMQAEDRLVRECPPNKGNSTSITLTSNLHFLCRIMLLLCIAAIVISTIDAIVRT